MEKDMNKKQQGILAEEQGIRYVDEDEKVEKFFAIIRRLRDARSNFSTNSLREMEAWKRMKKAKKVHVPIWTPTFQLEDFSGLDLADATQPSSSNNKGQGQEKKEELDLNLVL